MVIKRQKSHHPIHMHTEFYLYAALPQFKPCSRQRATWKKYTATTQHDKSSHTEALKENPTFYNPDCKFIGINWSKPTWTSAPCLHGRSWWNANWCWAAANLHRIQTLFGRGGYRKLSLWQRGNKALKWCWSLITLRLARTKLCLRWEN